MTALSMYVFMHVLQPANYPNVPTKRREHTPDSGQPAEAHCVRKLMELQKQVVKFSLKVVKFRLKVVECHILYYTFKAQSPEEKVHLNLSNLSLHRQVVHQIFKECNLYTLRTDLKYLFSTRVSSLFG